METLRARKFHEPSAISIQNFYMFSEKNLQRSGNLTTGKSLFGKYRQSEALKNAEHYAKSFIRFACQFLFLQANRKQTLAHAQLLAYLTILLCIDFPPKTFQGHGMLIQKWLSNCTLGTNACLQN